MKKAKKLISLLLAIVIVIPCFSSIVFAAEECTHEYSSQNYPATCIERSYTLYACSLCGHYYKDYNGSQNALGHNYGEWITVVEASCTQEGTMQRECARCSGSETKTIGVLAHKDADENGKCDVCGAEVKVEKIFSPFDWFVALFAFLREWFRGIFA